MRLGQLARKYDVSQQEIISYLKEIDPALEDLHHNSKLEESTATLVAKRFDSLGEPSDEIQTASQEYASEPEIADIPEVSPTPLDELEITEGVEEVVDVHDPSPAAEVTDLQEKEVVVIETDRLLELLESEESSVDLSKVTLIKAPKKELEGLKVLGKIDLPAPKEKTEDKQQENGTRSKRNARHPRRQLSEEEREKRRLKAKKKKEQYEARQEKRRKEQEKGLRKAINEGRYQEKLQRAKSNQKAKDYKVYRNHKNRIQNHQTVFKANNPRPLPKTLLGKFWRWLNTY